MLNNGFIKLHRKILNWEWWDDHNTFRLFMFILLSANHKDKKWHGHVVKRGQLITSRAKLAKKTGLSEQSIRTSLMHLKSTNEITIKATKTMSIITVNNYHDYQKINQLINQEPTNDQPRGNQEPTTTKELNNDKNDNNDKDNTYNQLFENLWSQYPRKLGKNKAYGYFKKSVKTDKDKEDIQKALENYIKTITRTNTEERYIKHGSSWFNNWTDYIEISEYKPPKQAYGNQEIDDFIKRNEGYLI